MLVYTFADDSFIRLTLPDGRLVHIMFQEVGKNKKLRAAIDAPRDVKIDAQSFGGGNLFLVIKARNQSSRGRSQAQDAP